MVCLVEKEAVFFVIVKTEDRFLRPFGNGCQTLGVNTSSYFMPFQFSLCEDPFVEPIHHFGRRESFCYFSARHVIGQTRTKKQKKKSLDIIFRTFLKT